MKLIQIDYDNDRMNETHCLDIRIGDITFQEFLNISKLIHFLIENPSEIVYEKREPQDE